MYYVILACDKKLASVRENKACPYCGQLRTYTHMRDNHPDKVELYRRKFRDENFKESIGSQDHVAFMPKWHRWGNKI